MEPKWSLVTPRLDVGFLSINRLLTEEYPDEKHDSRITTELRSVTYRLAELAFSRHFG